MKIYSIYDRVTRRYSLPVVQENDESAKRWFAYVVGNSDMVAADLELFYLCDFSQDTGNLLIGDTAFTVPMFIAKAEEVIRNEKA